jgi:hypothetical protein
MVTSNGQQSASIRMSVTYKPEHRLKLNGVTLKKLIEKLTPANERDRGNELLVTLLINRYRMYYRFLAYISITLRTFRATASFRRKVLSFISNTQLPRIRYQAPSPANFSDTAKYERTVHGIQAR